MDQPIPPLQQLPQHLVSIPGDSGGVRALVLADGEHYPQVVIDALNALRAAGWEIAGVALVGGTEKLRNAPDYGCALHTGSGALDATLRGCAASAPQWVVDVSDEPVLVLEERMRVIAAVTAMGIGYVGADAVVHAPAFDRVAVPSLAVIGTGKRIGKTAISAHLARIADAALGAAGDVVVVAMGRGGPATPVVVDRRAGAVTVESLLAISRAGSHAASDYLEDAALTGLTTVGCRRAGGGLLGAPVMSNVPDGARIVEQIGPRLAIFEGSGACIPPVRCDRTVLVGSTARLRDLFEDFGRYRLARADLVLVMGDDAAEAMRACKRLELLMPTLTAVAARLEPTPVGEIAGRRIGVFTTAPDHVGPILMRRMAELGGELVTLSHALARRDELRADVARAVERGADTFVVEIKAAGIDVVAEAAEAHGVDLVFLDNPPTAHDPSIDLDALLRAEALTAANA